MRLVGANVFAIFAFWVLQAHHTASFGELYLVAEFAGWLLMTSGLFWVLYIALEPFVRRRWPQIMVSWTRLLSGSWRDPLVGRDILAGCAFAAFAACLLRLRIMAPAWLGYPETMPLIPSFDALFGAGSLLSTVANTLDESILAAFALLLFVFLVRVVVRNEWIAAIIVGILVAIPSILRAEPRWIVGLIQMSYYLLFLFASIRFGILALVFIFFVGNLLSEIPITLDSSAWYSAAGYGAVLVILAITAFACHTSMGGRRLLDIGETD